MKILYKKSEKNLKPLAFTLVEVIITLSIFAIVAMLASVALINTMKTSKRIETQAFLYSEANAVMNQLSQAISSHAIDYEFYFSQTQGATGWDTPNYGQYGESFFSPGTGGPLGSSLYPDVSGLGAFCSSGTGLYPDDCPSDTPVSDELDTDTGAHPFTGISDFNPDYSEDDDSMNAFCEDLSGTGTCAGLDVGVSDQLVLINSSGDERLVFKNVDNASSPGDEQIAKLLLLGTDRDTDGLVESWACSTSYLCASTIPVESDFKPITPNLLDISFYVIISPVEDPYRAYSEGADMTQMQPQVTIILQATLSQDYAQGILGELPTITLQRTINTGVYHEITSYE